MKNRGSYNLYTIYDFPYEKIRSMDFYKPSKNNKNRRRYCTCVCAFDIETTRIVEIEQSILCTWQVCIEDCAVYGRSWEEYKHFLYYLTEGLPDDFYFIFFVHNLGYEFYFLSGVFPFNYEDVFFIKSREVLLARTGNIEYRCSYQLTQMKLELFTDWMDVENKKAKEYDYEKFRMPWDILSKKEETYILNDVVGLVQSLKKFMYINEDTLQTLPLTNTGFVRRDFRKAMRNFSRRWLIDMQPSVEIYNMLREAFRGGEVHANRYYTGYILENVQSIDRVSSYIEAMVNESFPMGKWMFEKKNCNIEFVLQMCRDQKRCILARVAMENVRLKNPENSCPYLTKAKCRKVYVKDEKNATIEKKDYMYDNGRILFADYLEVTITEIDLEIILDMYDFDSLIFLDVAHAPSRKLPKELIQVVMDYFALKTELKGIKGEDSYLYDLKKRRLNSTYGDCVQDPCKPQIRFFDGKEIIEEKTIEEMIEENKKLPYKSYAWGVWISAYARREFHKAVKMAQNAIDPLTGDRFDGFVYGDTDGIKYIGEIPEMEIYNQRQMIKSFRNGAYAVNREGKIYYMGVYDYENTYEEFKTLGAKKYCYVLDGDLHSTISGLSKEKAVVEMKNNIDEFYVGKVFHEAAGLEAVYNDCDYGEYEIDGYTLNITRNVVLRPTKYEIGISAEYERLLKNPDVYIAITDEKIYRLY